MKTMLIASDPIIIKMLHKQNPILQENLLIMQNSSDPLDVMSAICSYNPLLLIVDDDFLKPHSARILKSVRKLLPDCLIIFITSDASIELGREISQLGIQYYAYKPLEETDLTESLESILRLKMQHKS